jgi:serine protease inhibitor
MFGDSRAKTAAVAVSTLSILALTACGSRSTADQTDGGRRGEFLQSDVAVAHAARSVDFASTTRGLRDLGHDLATLLPADTGAGGQVFSPASLAIAFAMLREGAGPDSAREIDDVMRLPTDRQTAYNALLHALADVGGGDTLEVNDALFLDPELSVKQAYLDAIKKWYDAGLHQTEFPDPALEDINGWVKTHTHGRIPRLLDDLDPQAVFALVNTIYLNAKWAEPFDPDDTHDAVFTTDEGDAESVKTMHKQGPLDYADGDGWQAVRLPYAGGKLSMWVLVPDASGDPKDLLTSDVLEHATSGATRTTVDLSLPRWDTETKADLTDVLKRLGMGATIGATGQYPGITDDPRFFVSQVIQQANITVGEKGTEAAAATAIVGEVSGMVAQGAQVRADHPFAYAIVQDDSGAPLFEGVVADPSHH